MNYGCIAYAGSGKVRVVNEGGVRSVASKMNSYELCNDSDATV